MSDSAIVAVVQLGGPPWPTLDPFLFCVHHDDAYPQGNEAMGPEASLAGRNIGMDFEGKDGWRMYHGDVIPGFPRHPHRGFETVTIGRAGFVDHSDSLGATARFGKGDVQWMTAGGGIVHSEMFPLVKRDADNPTGLFQIWLNLPKADKMVEPYFTMLWRETIPVVAHRDDAGKATEVTVVAGSLGTDVAPPPPPNSWASRKESDIAIWTVKMQPGARWTLPRGAADAHRVLYMVTGDGVTLRAGGDTREVPPGHGAQLRPDRDVEVEGGSEDVELLVLHGRPIGEPVVQHGPFVMNTRGEIQQAMLDYQKTRFGGWPWKSDGPVHARDDDRFAIHKGGRHEKPPV